MGEPNELIDVLFVVPPHSLLLDVAGPAEAFRLANQHLRRAGRGPRFRLRYTGPQVQAESSVGLQLAALEPPPETLAAPTWLVLVGQPSGLLAQPDAAMAATVRWLKQAMRPALRDESAGHRLITICSGSLLAAQADLLGTRRCTTHHELLDALRALAPLAQVVDNRVFVLDGPLASSAGVTAGIDLSLHLIAQMCGDPVTAAVAKDMVVYLRRTPNDPELSPMLAHRHHLHPAVHRVQDAVSAQPAQAWDMAALSAVAHVTERHLLRLFGEHAGVSPLHYLEKIRLERARQSLQRGASVTRAAEAAGFNSDLQLRRAWTRHWGGSPRDAATSTVRRCE
ncbi:GlxA family transcriptional regulator [Piscinibacter sp.]|uniref:GlxA family transcriptional regulator n=1 Tax=Piscinibacter sp. TaxID=1903157 RepID=UPI002BA35A1B|nr:helix-turn-helix domain-containing protein [Albitalea sp.]HUG23238.1 helix-turn-helix domain-containing protein [Albitalea sp.]